MTDRDIMQQALEALETANESDFWIKQESIVKALRERLAQPEQNAVLAEREACIDLVAFYGGPVDLEAAIRAKGEHMTFDQWWATLSHKEQLTIGRNNARYVWRSACESCSEICKKEADETDGHLEICIEALLDCAEFIRKNGDV